MMKVDNETLARVVRESISFNGVLRKLGVVVNSGATWTHYKKRIEKLGLDTSHFLGKAVNRGINRTGGCNKKGWRQMLIKQLHRTRPKSQRLRRAFKEYCEEHGVEYQCACGNNGEWMGKPIKLQISHKDDDRSNNVPTNLEWICPNCHALRDLTNLYGLTKR